MKRVLYLNKTTGTSKNGHPTKFFSLDGVEEDNLDLYEKSLINRINNYNNKLNIQEIRYDNLSTLFPNADLPKYLHNGIMIREYEVNGDYKILNQKEEELFREDDKYYLRVIDAYVFTTMTTNETRNAYIAQMIFPTLTELIERFLEGPSYSLANHPIYVVNLYEKEQAKKIQRNIVQLKTLGINYIQMHEDINSFTKKNYNLYKFLNTFYDFDGKIVSTNDFLIDIEEKKLELKVGSNIVNNEGKIHGSNEKFYYMEILPIIYFAYKENYYINIANLTNFVQQLSEETNTTSKKLNDLKVILKYINKYIGEYK